VSLSRDTFRPYPKAADAPHPGTEETLIGMSIELKSLGANQIPLGTVLENIEKNTLGERVQGHKTFSPELGASQSA
jgi:hypothetical protein